MVWSGVPGTSTSMFKMNQLDQDSTTFSATVDPKLDNGFPNIGELKLDADSSYPNDEERGNNASI